MTGRALARPIRSLAAACLVSVTAGAAVMAPARGEPSAGVDECIAQLGADQFARREAAARALVHLGAPALAPLERAIRTGDLEVATRGVEVIRELLDAEDQATSDAAWKCLARLAAADAGTPAAELAEAAAEFHALAAATAARDRLESLGAVFRERSPIQGGAVEIEFNASWRGGPDDLRQLSRLRGLSAVSVHGVAIDDHSLAVLASLQGVQRIDLFGTGAGAEAARMLADHLPEARIDVRKGGKLGVSSLAFGGPCEVRTVEPGSAADQAGIRSGDVVLSIDGVGVTSFDDLTTRLGERAPGEVVTLAVARRDGTADGEPERVDCDVRLDAW